MKHGFWMLIGCALPLLVILLLPVFGLGESAATVVLLALMVLCPLTMFFGHARHGHTGTAKKL
jgi:cell division protein FtsW (lipid II flippase)